MQLNTFVCGALVCTALIMPRTSFADTLTLKSTGGQVVGGVEIYPYNLSLNGAAQTSPMMCLNYDDTVTFGESWQVTGQTLSTSSSLQLREDAFLYSQLSNGSYSNSDVQFAVWDILDPGVEGNKGFTNDLLAQRLVSLAENSAAGLTNSFLNQYTVYSPVTSLQAQASWTAGLPQSFITKTSAVTPEPASWLLLATGLGAASIQVSRRRSLDKVGMPVQ